jgi:hypothetical protein
VTATKKTALGLGIAALFALTAALTVGGLNMAFPEGATPATPTSRQLVILERNGWPQVIQTIDGSTTVVHPEDLDRETG